MHVTCSQYKLVNSFSNSKQRHNVAGTEWLLLRHGNFLILNNQVPWSGHTHTNYLGNVFVMSTNKLCFLMIQAESRGWYYRGDEEL